LGTNTGSTGSYDLSVLTGFNAIDVQADMTTAATMTFTKVAQGTSLAIDATTTHGIIYQTVVGTTDGVSDSVTVNLNGTAAGTGTGTVGITVNALTLQDVNNVGIAHVSLVTDASVGGGVDTITTLTDANLNTLNISGTGSLIVTNAITTAATSLTIANNNTSTAATTFAGFTDNTMGSLSYSGTHAATITTLSDTAANVSITNANTGTTGVLTIGGWTDATLTSLTLTGSVALTGTFADAAGVTIAGANDNSAVSVTVAGGGANSITLGNGGNTVVGGAGVDTIVLGTGASSVTAGAGADSITFGAHTGVDTVVQAALADSGTFAAPATNTISTTTFDVVTGMAKADHISLAANTGGIGVAAGLASANAVAANTLVGLAATDNGDFLVRGTYDATAHTFVGSATGSDTLFVYDGNSALATTAQEAVVLVGYHGGVTGINAAAGLVTLA